MRHDLAIAFSAMTVLLVALGIGRFIFTPLLSLMHDDLGLSLSAGGWMASTNNLGYLIGALGCSIWKPDARRTLRGGLLLASLATLAVGFSSHLGVWLALRLIGGIASAALVIHGIAFGLSRMREPTPRREAIVFAGPGVGIALSGVLCWWRCCARWA